MHTPPTFLHMDDVRKIGQVSSVEVQQVRNGIQVLSRLLSKILSYGLIGLTSVGNGFVQAHRVCLLVQLECLGQEFEGLSDLLILLLEPCCLFASKLIDGGVYDDTVLIHLLCESLEAFDFALHFLEVQWDIWCADENNKKRQPFKTLWLYFEVICDIFLIQGFVFITRHVTGDYSFLLISSSLSDTPYDESFQL